MSLFLPASVFLVACACCGNACAQRTEDALAGLVIDQTITVGGHEFFRQFASLWREQGLSARYVITVQEQPSARNGTQVWISHRGTRVFQARLPGRRADLAGLAQEASQAAQQNMVDSEVSRLLAPERDLAPVEM